ncbi:Phosphoribosylglycinamide formyltransferase [Bathymodiolus heckerae thiotrophic gill symbiont]|uniref:phosphoribosylglycinamide formyltransferase n=1 Tax=Bathymodiolus heckerae thiotrophic gill symbiont TaxID=1052212 RepID=UPI0010B24AE5|nr:phosphoribosylglycinamide formyltransferase [Bathymodiolus heckerae thiotrophic gill symbiont]SHN90318.1 Phosphoribosylglycinamide formyltransferase [Bathymodiolus heckerae thiotrophic gill symbiont]
MKGVVLISGSGSNLQSLIDNASSIDLSIEAVISNKKEAFGLQRAQQSNIPTHALDHKLFSSREDFDQNLSQLIGQYNPDIVILAGFMRILTAEFTQKYTGKMLNIHPSLLPKFQGLNTHQRALDAGEKEHGVSVHFVTAELDGGPIIAQSKIKVLANDDVESLAKRILIEEHKLFPEVIHWFTQDRLKLEKNQATLDGQLL